MLVPAHAFSGSKCVSDTTFRFDCRYGELKGSRQKRRAALVCKRECLLFRQAVLASRRVVIHVSACCLRSQPLAYVPLGCAGAVCQFFRSKRPRGGQRLVEIKLVADHHHRRMKRGSEIIKKSSDKLVHLLFINCHFHLVLFCGGTKTKT